MPIRSSRFPRPCRWPVLCLALVLPLSAAAELPPSTPAAPAALPAGDWRGSLALDARSMAAVRLLQQAGKFNLQFGAPLNCGLTLLAQGDGGYRLESINGGIYFDRLLGKTLTAQRSAADDLQLSIDGTPLPALLHALPGSASTLQGQLAPARRRRQRWPQLGPSDSGDRRHTAIARHRRGQVVRYGSPRNCHLQARYAGTSDTTLVYCRSP